MNLSRRSFFAGTAGALAATALCGQARAAGGDGFPIGACDWSMRVTGVEALTAAKDIGLDGVEISPGAPDDVLPIADPALQAAYKQAEQATGVEVASIALGLLNNHPFATEPRAPAWLEQTIAAAAALDAKVILVAFFGKGDLRDEGKLKAKDVDAVVDRLKAAAPAAEKAGITLGLENTLSAQDNLAILERVQSPAVRVYYDVCNSTNNGYDVPAEIRMLGDRICQIHLKENGCLLGDGKVDMAGIRDSVEAIDYQGWFVLETPILNDDMPASFAKNAAYARELFREG